MKSFKIKREGEGAIQRVETTLFLFFSLMHSLAGCIWWRQKHPITVQIKSAVVALPFMPDLSLCLGLYVPLSSLPFQSVPARLPGLGCLQGSCILAYLHYITSNLNEACWETKHTKIGWIQCVVKQSTEFSQHLWSSYHICTFLLGHQELLLV